MQIRIEIDVKPEELRRFLGLPDVAGLQEDLLNFVREKLGSAAESLDPATFVKENLQTLKSSAAWRRILQATKTGVKMAEPAVQNVERRARKVAEAAATVAEAAASVANAATSAASTAAATAAVAGEVVPAVVRSQRSRRKAVAKTRADAAATRKRSARKASARRPRESS